MIWKHPTNKLEPVTKMSRREQIKQTIMRLVRERGPGKTICPSEAARALDDKHWRSLMDAVREAAINLHGDGTITIEQDGKPIRSDKFTGPVRLRIRN